MRIGREFLKPVKTPLIGFTGEAVESEGIITLPLTAGERPQQTTVMIDFLVFPTEHGVGRVQGDQGVARQCYVASLKGKTKSSETLAIESLEPEDKGQKSGEPVEDLVSIPLYEGNQEKIVKIGSLLDEDVNDLIAQLDYFRIQHVPQTENAKVDALSKLATSPYHELIKTVPVEILPNRSIEED
ncbi:hypothetical protein DH2020_002593 [Rehmannia glutinosa]|uniref:Uncharacterized protein n=1 Tax=Rehmannia glutinosa TaxID=99300 RepID=A0ABR0XU81_REHGL